MPIRNVHDRIRIAYPKNPPVLKYAHNGEIILCFGSFESAWAEIRYAYTEQVVARIIEQSHKLCSYRYEVLMYFDHGMMLSRKFVRRKCERQIKWNAEEWKIVLEYDPTRYMVNFVTLFIVEYIYWKLVMHVVLIVRVFVMKTISTMTCYFPLSDGSA